MKVRDKFWLIGLLEGEGSFQAHKASPVISVQMTDKDTIVRAANLMSGTVKVYQPTPPRKTTWYTRAYGDNAIQIMKSIKLHMSERRQCQINSVLEKMKGRPGGPKGSLAGSSKLKERWIPLLRRLHYEKGIKQKTLAKICNISPNAMHAAVVGKTWRHV